MSLEQGGIHLHHSSPFDLVTPSLTKEFSFFGQYCPIVARMAFCEELINQRELIVGLSSAFVILQCFQQHNLLNQEGLRFLGDRLVSRPFPPRFAAY